MSTDKGCGTTVRPKLKVGDAISWNCDSCGDVHTGTVAFAVPGFCYDPPHYEVEDSDWCGEGTAYVDETDVVFEN